MILVIRRTQVANARRNDGHQAKLDTDKDMKINRKNSVHFDCTRFRWFLSINVRARQKTGIIGCLGKQGFESPRE
jgi:hypothetical protein